MSDILIKGMNMPKSCAECPCCHDTGLIGISREYFCAAIDNAPDIPRHILHNSKLENCPSRGILTPHGRLIDADKFLEWLYEFYPQQTGIMSGIKNARTIIEAEE